jgi:hypothetical protein
MDYEVLNPWAEVDPVQPRPLNPRVTSLEGKTIGLYSFFKQHAPFIMKEVEQQLQQRFPTAKFKHFQYPVHVVEIMQDDDYKADFEEFVRSVDTVITGNGD